MNDLEEVKSKNVHLQEKSHLSTSTDYKVTFILRHTTSDQVFRLWKYKPFKAKSNHISHKKTSVTKRINKDPAILELKIKNHLSPLCIGWTLRTSLDCWISTVLALTTCRAFHYKVLHNLGKPQECPT